MAKNDWIETQMLRKNFNLREIVNEKFLKCFEEEFGDITVKVLNIDVVLMDENDSIVDIISMNHKTPSFEAKNQAIIDSNREPYFMSKIKKTIDSYQQTE